MAHIGSFIERKISVTYIPTEPAIFRRITYVSVLLFENDDYICLFF